jgi:hypothetical protein
MLIVYTVIVVVRHTRLPSKYGRLPNSSRIPVGLPGSAFQAVMP